MCSSARSAPRTCRWVRTSASATGPRATRGCSPKTSASRRAWQPLLEVEGEIVSSSHIRGLVLAGEVEQATRFLGAPFQLRGEVVHGDERGRELGFPTANLIPDDALVCPGHGVYACLADSGRRAPRPPRSTSVCARPSTRAAGS